MNPSMHILISLGVALASSVFLCPWHVTAGVASSVASIDTSTAVIELDVSRNTKAGTEAKDFGLATASSDHPDDLLFVAVQPHANINLGPATPPVSPRAVSQWFEVSPLLVTVAWPGVGDTLPGKGATPLQLFMRDSSDNNGIGRPSQLSLLDGFTGDRHSVNGSWVAVATLSPPTSSRSLPTVLRYTVLVQFPRDIKPGAFSLRLSFALRPLPAAATPAPSAVEPRRLETLGAAVPSTWEEGLFYGHGETVVHGGALYECLQSHAAVGATAMNPWQGRRMLWLPIQRVFDEETADTGTTTGTETTGTTSSDTGTTSTDTTATTDTSDSGEGSDSSSTYPPVWAIGVTYALYDLVQHNGFIYESQHPHTSNSGWAPDIPGIEALWKYIGPVDATTTTGDGSGGDSGSDPIENVPLAVTGIEDGGVYATGVVIKATGDSSMKLTIDGIPYFSGTAFTRKGYHRFIAKDSDETLTYHFLVGPPTPNEDPNRKRVVAYFASWGVYDRNYHANNIGPYADKITHIFHAFANIVDGEIALGDAKAETETYYPGDLREGGELRGTFNQYRKLKEDYPHISTMISVGGWSWSGLFSDVAATDAARKKFATSAVNFMLLYGFDGIDLDWEYPVSGGMWSNIHRWNDDDNLDLLLAEIRQQLNGFETAFGRRFLLSIATPAGYGKLVESYNLATVSENLDFIAIMAYDYSGTWDSATGFNAPMMGNGELNIKKTVTAYLEGALGETSNIPASKLVLGLPFYARSYGNVAATNNGYQQAFQGAGPGTWEPGVLDYKDVAANYVGKNGYVRYWNEESQVPFLYNGYNFISYDDPESIKIKVNYAMEMNLSGVMVWELSGDTRSGDLITAIDDALTESFTA